MPHLVKKYGPKVVEERFEQQLNLALQSLGFITVPTRRGARRGDLLCVTSGDTAAAILVEAKTSTNPYKLPVADERALAEYATAKRVTLVPFPAATNTYYWPRSREDTS